MAANDWDVFKEELRARCDIADIVGGYVPLKRAGTTLKGLCPFHREKTPSFNVDPRRQMYHCFGCGAGGDVFSFVQNIEKTDFRGAIELLARKTGMEHRIPRGAAGGGGVASGERDRLFQLHDELTAYYQELLRTSPEAVLAREYLARRQLDEATVKAWRIGYALNRFDDLERWGKTRGFEAKLMVTAGVLAVRDEGARAGEPYDRFRGRVMFPICDPTGRVIAFSGRILDEEASPAKYMNSPETPIFKKSMVLFALDQAREHLIESKQALLCEGQIDTIRCHVGGFRNAVAAQGTALTEEHIRLFKRYGVDEVVLVPDADAAGQRAARRALDLVLRGNMLPRVALLPDDDDPDTLILRQGPEAMRQALSHALSAVEYAFQTLAATEDLDSPAGRLRVTRGLAALIRQAGSEVMREQMLAEAAARLQVSPAALKADLAQAVSAQPIQPAEPPPAEAVPATAPASPAHPQGDGADASTVLELLIHHPTLLHELTWLVEKLHLSEPAQEAIRQTFMTYRPDQHPDWHHYLADRDAAARSLAAALLMTPKVLGKEFGDPRAAVTQALMELCQKKLEHRKAVRQRALAGLPAGERQAREWEVYQLSVACIKLREAHLARDWTKAQPILETFLDDL